MAAGRSLNLWIAALLLASCAQLAFTSYNYGLNRSHFMDELLKGYDNRVPPNFDKDEATKVTCAIHIASIDSISESTMDYAMSIFLRQKWVDSRLSFRDFSNDSVITLDARMTPSLWVPDLFFANEKKSHFHDVTVPNKYIRIFANGTLFYSVRVSLTAACPMNLQKFPLDTQTCSLTMESYAYTTERLHFEWRTDDPVELDDELQLPQFHLTDYHYSDCTKHYATGSFPCLRVEFVLARDIGFFMIQTFVPSALVVILSWVSFWISIEAVPARISLGVLTILTMTTQSSGSRQDLPRVSYIKAIDVWMTTCLVFVFAALLEFAIVNVLSRKEVRRLVLLNLKKEAQKEGDSTTASPMNVLFNAMPQAPSKQFMIDPEGKEKARMVDKWSRRTFPLVFLLFNFIFWLTYSVWEPKSN